MTKSKGWGTIWPTVWQVICRISLPHIPVFRHDYFDKKVAVMTGAASGIGKAVACELAERGTKLALTAWNDAEL
jgi:hypothetical protein